MINGECMKTIWLPRVYWKQPLYPHKIGIRSAYTLPSPDPTVWDNTGYVVVVVVEHEDDDLVKAEKWNKGIGMDLPSPDPTVWDNTGYVVVVVVEHEDDDLVKAEKWNKGIGMDLISVC